MVHIVFDKEDAEALRKSFELDESLDGDILVLDDDWSIGPLIGTINSNGEATGRDEWLARLFRMQPEGNFMDELKKLLKRDEESIAWIWIAPNARDVCGYYHLISNLEKYKARICTLWLNNLPFINEKGLIFYPRFLKEIPAREFVKAKRLAQQVSGATFETDTDDWKNQQRDNKMVRTLEGAKKIAGKEETFFDKEILQLMQNDWQKSSRIINHFLSKEKGAVNKSYLLWRIRELISKDLLAGNGDWPSSDNFEVKKNQSIQSPVNNE